MKKRLNTTIVLVLLLVVLLQTFSFATAYDTHEEPSPASRYTYLSYITATITAISGKANCYARASAYSSYHLYMTVSLQKQQTNGSWTTVKSWSTSGVGSCSLDKLWSVVSGYYRVIATVSVYNSGGSLVESGYSISPSRYI